MSRMGNKPIEILEGVTVDINRQEITCKGKAGQMIVNVHPKIKINKNDNQIILERAGNDKLSKAIHGVSRKLLINAIAGVTQPFEKRLDINGIGYRVSGTNKELQLTLGYSHPVKVQAPENIEFKIVKNSIIVSGIDKQLVGQIAAQIRSLRMPEPYKGKGIKYHDEIIKRKAGKAAKSGGEGK